MHKVNTLFYLVLAAFLLPFIQGCSSREDISVPDEPEITGIANPITLQTDSTFIVLQDFFRHPKGIDSIATDKNLGFRVSPDSTMLTLFVKDKALPKLSELNVWIGGFRYSILLKKSPKIWQHFVFDPKEKRYKKVQIAGDMNDWNPAKTNFKQNGKIWEGDMLIYPGKYQYKLVIDGKWMLDPNNPEKADNNIGGFNSVMYAGSVTPQGAPILFTGKSGKNEVVIGVKNKAREFFVYWQNYRLDSTFTKTDSAGLTIRIPGKAKKFDRSWLRVVAYNNAGTSNDILIPLDGGKVITDASKLTRSDKQTMIIYSIMIDRFMNGDPKNDAPLKDKDIDPKLNFQGGDLAGILQKVDDGYFTGLGVNTLWISPVTQNPLTAWAEYPAPHRKFSGYHGYWPITLTTVDTRFGTPDEFRKLVDYLHDRKMNILLDYVSNHVHQESAIYKNHPDWATPLILPNKQKNIRLWNEQRLTTWFDEFLPTLDLSKPEVYNMVSDSALFWVQEYKIDGFRHDAAKHIPEIYWRTLTGKIKEEVEIPENRSFYQIGETFGSRELIRSYINPGMLDAQFDFSIYFDALNAFAKDNGSLKDLNYSVMESFSWFGNHSLMGNITGNQDLTRFITIASGALKPGENAAEAGWKRDIEVKDTIGYGRLAQMIAFNMTIPGIPVIYYGDEFGMPGAGDPDNRRMMRFDSLSSQEKRMKEITQKLTHLRSSSMPLLYGDYSVIEVSDRTFVYIRSYFDQVAIAIFSKDSGSKKIDFMLPERYRETALAANFGNIFTSEKGKISLTLKGNSFEILTNKAED
jgi:cyclomaltodextrinase / maltogenic alpha-amylase / neopullulanase